MIWSNIPILNDEESAELDAYVKSFGSQRPACAQLLRVYWKEGVADYSFVPFSGDPIYKNTSLEPDARLRLTDAGPPYFEIKRTLSVSPDKLQIVFNDQDKKIRRLMRKGENTRAEVFLYYPGIDRLVSEFVGQLKRGTRQRGPVVSLELVAGFRPNLFPATTQLIFDTGCSAVFGGNLSTWREVSRNSCRFNIHLADLPEGVERIGNIDPATGAPYAFCPKTSQTVCGQVSGKPEQFAGGGQIQNTTTVGSGARTTIAKPHNVVGDLTATLGVLFGYRRGIPFTTRHFVRQSPGSNSGSMVAIAWGSAGPVSQIFNLQFRGKYPQGQIAFNGEYAQSTTAYVRQVMGQDVGNFSKIAYALVVENPVNPSTIKNDDLAVTADMLGFAEVRVTNDDGSESRSYTEISAWCLREWLQSLQFGLALPERDFVDADFVKLAAWDRESVNVLTPSGAVITATRNRFNQLIANRKAEDVIYDWTRSMRYSPLFVHGGKLRVIALERWDLANVPLFRVGDGQTFGGDVYAYTDGEFKGMPEIEPLYKNADELPLRLRVTFDDDENGVPGRPLTFEDDVAIKAARLANEDVGWQVPERSVNWYGVTNYAQAVRASNFELKLGEYDSGGTANNFGVRMVTHGADSRAVNMHPGAVFELDWPEFADEVEPVFNEPIRYFRVMKDTRRRDLKREYIAWAYPKRFYECYGGNAVEAETAPPIAGADFAPIVDEIP